MKIVIHIWQIWIQPLLNSKTNNTKKIIPKNNRLLWFQWWACVNSRWINIITKQHYEKHEARTVRTYYSPPSTDGRTTSHTLTLPSEEVEAHTATKSDIINAVIQVTPFLCGGICETSLHYKHKREVKTADVGEEKFTQNF